MRMLFVLLVVPFTLLVAGLAMSISVHADEGMWVFNNLPLEQLKASHGFEPPPGWAEHLRSAAVRFNNGGSGSFVSADGLIMTNHHVGADTLAKLGTATKDYYRDGFFAHGYEEEAKAPDLELNALIAIEDVTERVNHDVTPAWTTPRPAWCAAGDGPDREGSDREKWAPQRCRHPLSRRAISPLHLQEIHRRPAGFRARVRHRLFRRRSRQLRVSAV